MAPEDRRTANLRDANKKKSSAARAAVISARGALRREGEKININAVARRSSVSRGFIYAHPELKSLIEADAELSRNGLRRGTSSPNEASLSARLAVALSKIEEYKRERAKHRADMKALENRIEALTAQLFELQTDRWLKP